MDPITKQEQMLHDIAEGRKAEEKFESLGLGITAVQFVILAFVYNNPRCTMQEVARARGVTPAVVTGLADRLEKHDYVMRLPYPDDRRKTILEITTKGVTKLADIFSAIDLLEPVAV